MASNDLVVGGRTRLGLHTMLLAREANVPRSFRPAGVDQFPTVRKTVNAGVSDSQAMPQLAVGMIPPVLPAVATASEPA